MMLTVDGVSSSGPGAVAETGMKFEWCSVYSSTGGQSTLIVETSLSGSGKSLRRIR